MGSLRRRLIAGACLLPATARAETCATLRPGWTEASGIQTAWAETAYILGSPPGFLLFVLLALALVFPRLWLAIPAALLTIGFAGLLAVSRQSGMAVSAQAEGCIASATPAIAALVLAAILVIARALHVRRCR